MKIKDLIELLKEPQLIIATLLLMFFSGLAGILILQLQYPCICQCGGLN